MTTEPKSRRNPTAAAAGTLAVQGADRTVPGLASHGIIQRPRGDGREGHRTSTDRLRAIADRLRVPVESFFAGTVSAIEDVPPVLELLRHPEAVRLIRAFAAIPDPVVRQRLLSAAEAAAAGERAPGDVLSEPSIDAERDGSPDGQR